MLLKEDNRIVHLSSDKSIPDILENQKKSKERIYILFTSLWSDTSNNLLEAIEDSYTRKNKIYVVNSFDSPKSFTCHGKLLFNRVTCEPTLMRISGAGSVRTIDYVPFIYDALGL